MALPHGTLFSLVKEPALVCRMISFILLKYLLTQNVPLQLALCLEDPLQSSIFGLNDAGQWSPRHKVNQTLRYLLHRLNPELPVSLRFHHL